jgi:hypothetical protein
MNRRAESVGRVENEIRAEKAAALGRVGERLEAALNELRDVAQRLAEPLDESRGAELRAAYRAALEQVRTARLHLLIQREAIGLRNHRVVDQQFPEPAPPPWL